MRICTQPQQPHTGGAGTVCWKCSGFTNHWNWLQAVYEEEELSTFIINQLQSLTFCGGWGSNILLHWTRTFRRLLPAPYLQNLVLTQGVLWWSLHVSFLWCCRLSCPDAVHWCLHWSDQTAHSGSTHCCSCWKGGAAGHHMWSFYSFFLRAETAITWGCDAPAFCRRGAAPSNLPVLARKEKSALQNPRVNHM